MILFKSRLYTQHQPAPEKKKQKIYFVFLHRHRTHRQSGWVSPVHHDWVQFRSNFAHLSQFCHHRLRLILLFVCVVIANCSIRLFFVLLFSLIAVECTKQKCGFAICCFYVVMYTWDIHVFHRYDQCWTTSHIFIYVSKVQKVSGVFDVWPCGVSHASAPQLLRVIVAIQLKLQHTKISNSLISTIHIMYAASAGAAVASVGKTRLAVCIFLWHCTTLCWSK